MTISIEDMATFCKKKGFVFRSADIYGGLSGFFDYGPLGVELKRNLKQAWYKFIVQDRENVVAMDGSIITNPKVWKASGHIDGFADLVLTTKKTKTKIRADHFIEKQLKVSAEGLNAEEIQSLINQYSLKYKGEEFAEVHDFNIMFSTKVGASAEHTTTAYLRPETCQSIFPNFKLVMETSRQKLPFGIAQIGKAFRNEISPRDFLFRSREFEQLELEFFVHPEKPCENLSSKHKETSFQFWSSEQQEENKDEMQNATIKDLIKQNKMNEWQGYWLSEIYLWMVEELGITPENLRIREHMKTELSHYSSATFDIDYKFPFGFKEIHGCANRGSYDLTQHQEHSGSKLEVFDEASQQKVLPHVIEPSQGVDRLLLALLFEAYKEDTERGNIVLHLPHKLAPYHIAVFPLVKNKPAVLNKAREVYNELKKSFVCQFDASGSVGRRYARADEIGIPHCITIDFETLEDNCVTIRNRDTTKQERVKISELKEKLD